MQVTLITLMECSVWDVSVRICVFVCAVFLISSYGAPLDQRVSYLALQSSVFEPDGAVNFDYIVTNSINLLLIGSRCIPNCTCTNHC